MLKNKQTNKQRDEIACQMLFYLWSKFLYLYNIFHLVTPKNNQASWNFSMFQKVKEWWDLLFYVSWTRAGL